MKRTGLRLPPFKLDRMRRGELAKQLADALRNAIITGYYRAGDVLPPVRELAVRLDVSKGIAEQSIARLREEGLISPRPRIGSVVCERNRPLWKGQVLIVVPPGIGNPGDNAVYSVLRDALTANRYLSLVATVPYVATESGRRYDFALIDTMMRQQIDLIVQLHNQEEIASWLSRRGVPFVRYTQKMQRRRNCAGAVILRYDLALADFVAHCRESGVKSALEVSVWREGIEVSSALKRIGVDVETLRVPLDAATRTAYGLAKWAADEFLKRKALPELVFFQDDHLAAGALLAFGERGIKTPHDVRVVTWANRDYGPVSLRPFTRMEMDVAAFGEKVAACVLECLRTGVFPKNMVVGPKYVRGETF